MQIYQLLLIFITVIAMAAGQILFKLAANEMQLSLGGFLKSLLNIKLIIALFIYAFSTVLWLIVLKLTPLRVAYPFLGLTFMFVPVFSRLFLGEAIHWQNFAGVALICLGIWITSSY
jgi:multidrug transporter EmrE-like cation transporter